MINNKKTASNHNNIIKPLGTYVKNTRGVDKTFLIFKYESLGMQHTNYAVEMPKGVDIKDISAMYDGAGILELIIEKKNSPKE